MSLDTVDERRLREVALTPEEYRAIVEELKRSPNEVELGMLGVLWSEHCSYKSSKALLRRLPSTGSAVLQGPGENAGAVNIGDGWAVVFKIESHNHPSAIEPYQGAATGVGGIIRDVIAMGARPIALLDSLRFGPLPASSRHFEGVVAGIGGYGNCIGIPTVAGEVYFDECYANNPLVNAMCVGLVRVDRLMRARAEGTGNSLMLVGADTGRDGDAGVAGPAVGVLTHGDEALAVGHTELEVGDRRAADIGHAHPKHERVHEVADDDVARQRHNALLDRYSDLGLVKPAIPPQFPHHLLLNLQIRLDRGCVHTILLSSVRSSMLRIFRPRMMRTNRIVVRVPSQTG